MSALRMIGSKGRRLIPVRGAFEIGYVVRWLEALHMVFFHLRASERHIVIPHLRFVR